MVKLWDLKLKEDKVHEVFAEAYTSPVEFTAGTIGSMQVKTTWGGQVEISASNVVLNLNLTPMQALKAAILPGPRAPVARPVASSGKAADADGTGAVATPASDGFVYTVAEMRQPEYFQSMLDGTQPPQQVPPRYCRFHQRPDRRKQGEVRMCQCTHCHVQLQTNFKECALCARCSDKKNSCLLCGVSMPPGTTQVPSCHSETASPSRRMLTPCPSENASPSRSRSHSPQRQVLGKIGPGRSCGEPVPVARSAETQNGDSPGLSESAPGSQSNSPSKSVAFEQTPRGCQPQTPRKQLALDDDLEVPQELGIPLHNNHDSGGASIAKTPRHTHWRHRWQHHHVGHESTDDLLVPPPTDSMP